MVKIMLFIEGTKDDTNGDLRRGFSKLLAQKLEGRMPRIKMGNGVSTTVKAFCHNKMSESAILLIDLDGPSSERSQKLTDYKLQPHQEDVFFMIQEMEAWFFSQPEVLCNFYGSAISTKIPSKNAEDIINPARELMKITRLISKQPYHKVKHGVRLLERLDADKLEKSSPEFARLVKRLQMI
jgi:hypothetical protein